MAVSPPPEAPVGLVESLRETARAARAYLAEVLELAFAEARLSITVLTMVAILAVAIALLAVSAWLALLAAAVVLAVRAGAAWPAALLGVAALNGLAGVGLAIYVRSLIRSLGLPATRAAVALQAPHDLPA